MEGVHLPPATRVTSSACTVATTEGRGPAHPRQQHLRHYPLDRAFGVDLQLRLFQMLVPLPPLVEVADLGGGTVYDRVGPLP